MEWGGCPRPLVYFLGINKVDKDQVALFEVLKGCRKEVKWFLAPPAPPLFHAIHMQIPLIPPDHPLQSAFAFLLT